MFLESFWVFFKKIICKEICKTLPKIKEYKTTKKTQNNDKLLQKQLSLVIAWKSFL